MVADPGKKTHSDKNCEVTGPLKRKGSPTERQLESLPVTSIFRSRENRQIQREQVAMVRGPDEKATES